MTTWWGWGVRRARSSSVLLLTLLALVAVTSGILSFVLGNSGAQATTAARAALTSAAPGEVAIQAQTRLGPDPLAQDELGRDRLAAGFAPAPISIWSTIVSEPRPVAVSGQPIQQRLVLWSGAHLLPDQLDVDGQWPASPGEAALHQDTADALGIARGETLTIDGLDLTISALWRPADGNDPRWLGDELALRGVDGARYGPLVVDASAITDLQQPFIRWAVAPLADRISGEHLSALADGAERAKSLVADADVTGRGITTEGDLAPTAARAARELAVAEAFGILPVSLLLLVAVVGLAQVAVLLDATREKELQLLLARGSSPLQLMGAAVAENLLLASVGATAGVGVAAAALRLIAGTWTHTSAVLGGGLLSLTLALACLIAVAINGSVRAARGGRPSSDRVRAVAGAATLVVVGGVAALATWQLRREAAFVRTLDGDITADVIAALAPAALLAAASVVGLVVLAPVGRALELAVRQLHGAGAWLAGAQLARGLVVQAVPVVLTILATGTATFAALYAGTGAALARDAATLGQGAELRASLNSSSRPGPLGFATLQGVPGVTASAPVWLDPNATIGNLTLTSLAAPMGVFSTVAQVPDGQLLPAAELDLGQPDSHAPLAIPPGSRTLLVELGGTVQLDAWAQETLRLLPSYHRAGSVLLPGEIPDDAREEMAREAIEADLSSLAQPVTVTTTLTLRDAHTGESSTVAGPVLTIGEAETTTSEDFSEVAFAGGDGRAALEISLPAERSLVIDAVSVEPSRPLSQGFSIVTPTVAVTLAVSADAQPLLGTATADWGADTALAYSAAEPYRAAEASVTPAVELVDTPIDTGSGEVMAKRLSSNRPTPPISTIDTTGSTWRLTFTDAADPLVVGPHIELDSAYDPRGIARPGTPPPLAPVPVAITPALSEATMLDTGDRFELTLFGRGVPAEVAAITSSVPGLATPLGLLLDSGAWGAMRSATRDRLVAPTELWAKLDGDPAQAGSAAGALRWVAEVTLTDTGGDRSAPATQSFWVAAASALTLAITGLAAAAATQVAHRRPEVAVLRALGMPPAAQSRSRTWEIGGILLLATLAGVGSGWAVAWLTLDAVTRSASAEPVAFATRLTLDAAGWLTLLATGAAAVIAILRLVSAAVHRQALDAEYREEVR